MAIRRGLMAQMASGADKFFEVVERFSPTEKTQEHTFTHHGAGFYIFCEDPVPTEEKFVTDASYDNTTLMQGNFVIYENSAGVVSGAKAGTSTIWTRKNSPYVDYWGTYCAISGNEVTFRAAGSNTYVGNFLAGHTYVVLKLKCE
jgi:hypothetical protein